MAQICHENMQKMAENMLKTAENTQKTLKNTQKRVKNTMEILETAKNSLNSPDFKQNIAHSSLQTVKNSHE